MKRTGTHVVRAATSKVPGLQAIRRETKISESRYGIVIAQENVLRLDIAMEDILLVTVLNGIKELNEDRLDKSIVLLEDFVDGNGGEHVSP
jgi:hypothetical protein